MIKLLVLLAISLVLAYISQQHTVAITAAGHRYSVRNDWAYILLVVALTLFTGLRIHYNDTQNYIRGFYNNPGLAAFLSNPKNLHPLKNPLFFTFENLLKDLTDNAQILIFTTSLFAQCCFIKFIKRYSANFPFGIFLYFTLGTFALSMAAIKQVSAMAILTLAIPCLEKKQLARYYLLVFCAMLVHTYAIIFAVLPFFTQKPWGTFTYIFVIAVVILMGNFREVISAFLEQADEMGKNIAEYEVFDDNTINIFRIAVYAVPPLISFVFQKWIFHRSSDIKHVLVHMSIISLAFMAMGTQSGANMFGRMANYFELGTVCCLPWMLEKPFDRRSHKLILAIAAVCFLGFFLYANKDFGSHYSATNLLSLF